VNLLETIFLVVSTVGTVTVMVFVLTFPFTWFSLSVFLHVFAALCIESVFRYFILGKVLSLSVFKAFCDYSYVYLDQSRLVLENDGLFFERFFTKPWCLLKFSVRARVGTPV
jgi:hypothetical protein